jgi:hypothetical protein
MDLVWCAIAVVFFASVAAAVRRNSEGSRP